MISYQPNHLDVEVDKEAIAKEAAKPKIRNKKEWMTYLRNEMNSRLNLAYQDLEEVPEKVLRKYSTRIKSLDISHNKIRDFKFLLDVPKLESLILDHNELTSQVKFPCLPKLHTLWMNHNNVTNLVTLIKQLWTSFPNLKYLSLMNNEAAPSYFNGGTYEQYKDYRYYVISQLPKLTNLDDTPVTVDERTEAERIYTKISMGPTDRSTSGMVDKKIAKKRSKFTKSNDADLVNTEGKAEEYNPKSQKEIHRYLLESLPTIDDLTDDMCSMENAAIDEDIDEYGNSLEERGKETEAHRDKQYKPLSREYNSLSRDPIMDSLPDLADLDIYGDISRNDGLAGDGDNSWSSGN